MIQVELVHGEPREIVKNNPSRFHVADGIRTVEKNDALIDFFQQGQQFSVPSQGIDRNSIILLQQVVVGADLVDPVGRVVQDDGEDELALDEIGV